MKVVQVNAVHGVGSTGRIVTELHQGLTSRGIESRIAFSEGAPTEFGFRIGTSLEKKFHAFASRVTGKQAHYSTHGTAELLEYLATENPDVVHLHNLHANFVNLQMLLQFLSRHDIATVVTLHDCWFYTGKCCHYTLDDCARWKSGCGSCPRVHVDNPSWLIDRSASLWSEKRRLFSAIPRLAAIGVSDWVTGEVRNSLLSSAVIIERIYNWVDVDVFAPRDSGATKRSLGLEGSFVILGVASKWSDTKGLADVRWLAERLSGEQSGALSRGGPAQARTQVLLVGGCLESARLPDTIGKVGPIVDPRELADYYSAADVLLQLSREETFGKVTAEALACGTPAIVYNSTANPELIEERCGYVVEPGDTNAVLDGVREVRRLGRSFFGPSCRESAVRRFNSDDRIDDHVRLYERLCRMKQVN